MFHFLIMLLVREVIPPSRASTPPKILYSAFSIFSDVNLVSSLTSSIINANQSFKSPVRSSWSFIFKRSDEAFRNIMIQESERRSCDLTPTQKCLPSELLQSGFYFFLYLVSGIVSFFVIHVFFIHTCVVWANSSVGRHTRHFE